VQVGSAQELVLHPVNDYVRDFTRDVSRLRVLTAASVMLEAQDGLTGAPVPASTRLDRLLAIVLQSEQPLPVIDEQSQIVGCVNRQCVLDALQGE
jgi:glycine betaine/proline transport system ATP-binding protein